MVTRLGLYGGPRGLYGSFAGKTALVITGKYRGFLININKINRIGLG